MSSIVPEIYKSLDVYTFAPSGNLEGLQLSQLPEGSRLDVTTAGHTYRIVVRGGHQATISGHPRFCPKPVLASFFEALAPGSRMEFQHPVHGVVSTSPICEIRRLGLV
jgi:hypothetical protein